MPEKLTEATKPELTILKVLWRETELSASEIGHLVGEKLGWSTTTVRTAIDRMCGKGLVRKRSLHGLNVYSANVSKVALMGSLIKDFTTRVLELDSAPSAALFADSHLLDEEEIAELEALLKRGGEE